ncbi:hypothetical protein BV22DRAFT_301900 [Leucogyrophana mollusca]|uniref:Uncharacterized protein n=1 Tax=Leucogyrophana mollusca TaxID=85980 RepID=A0ACB8BMI0_9AGAM|nr:hypothetical protein BV22DRAFT_301900 [Leucogyrophana mollusca]
MGTLRPPVLPPPPLRNTPSPTPLSPSIIPSPARERSTLRRSPAVDSTDEVQLVKHNDFAFPPRTVSRAKSKLSTSVPTPGEDETLLGEPATRDDRVASPTSTTEGDWHFAEPSDEPDPMPTQNTPPSPHSTRALPNIEIPPPLQSTSDTASTPPLSLSPPEFTSSRPGITAKQSRNNLIAPAAGGPFSAGDRYPGSAAGFQFPPPSRALASAGPSIASAYHPRSHTRVSPTHASASSVSNFLPNHQTGHSLDLSSHLQPQRPPPTGPLPLPPSVSRVRSANAATPDSPSMAEASAGVSSLSRKPSLNRQASVAIMETTPTSPLMPPIKPFAVRERSGSSSSKGSDGSASGKSLVLPGLREAIKVRSRSPAGCPHAHIFA